MVPLAGLLSTASNLGPWQHNNSAELRSEQRARRVYIQTARVRAVLTHVGANQPAEVLAGFGAGAITRALKLRHTPSTGVAHRFCSDRRIMRKALGLQDACRLVASMPRQGSPHPLQSDRWREVLAVKPRPRQKIR